MLNGTLAATKLLMFNTTKLKTAVESVANSVNSMSVTAPSSSLSSTSSPSSSDDESSVSSSGSGNVTTDENVAINTTGNNTAMKIWRFFSHEERVFLSDTFKKVINKSDFGAELILAILEDNYELFNILIGKPDGKIIIETPEQLRKDFPKAARIGDGIQFFLSEIIADLNDDNVSSGVIIKKCRVLGAKHKRYRINFQAESWLSIKRVIVNTILNIYFKKHGPFANKFIRNASNFLWASANSNQQEKIALIWQKLVEVVVKNMKAGFLDSASYGPEFVENEIPLDTEQPVMLR